MKKKILYFWCILTYLCITPVVSFAQTINVEGTVEDESGETLIGVSVQIKGSSTGTITDLDGKFILPSVPSDATLVFSYIGYKSLELKPRSKMKSGLTGASPSTMRLSVLSGQLSLLWLLRIRRRSTWVRLARTPRLSGKALFRG